jgi:hypothetical protein
MSHFSKHEKNNLRKERMVQAPNGEEYIVRAYTDDLSGLVIPDEFVVKASNGRFWLIIVDDIALKCTNHLPTYGLCFDCFGSGPTGLHCQACRNPNRIYNVVLYEEKIVEATWLSRLFETTHNQAMADRTWNRIRAPIFELQIRHIMRKLEFKYLDKEDSMALIREDLNHFQYGVVARGPGTWDCLNRRGNVIYISEKKENIYSGI